MGRSVEIGSGTPGYEIKDLYGWHASWFGHDTLILDKLESYVHASEARDRGVLAEGVAGIERRRMAGFDLFGTRVRVEASPRLPVYAHLLPGHP